MRKVQKDSSKMQKGTVKWFSNLRNYGFIESNSGQSYFFHRSDIKDSMEQEKQQQETRVFFIPIQNRENQTGL